MVFAKSSYPHITAAEWPAADKIDASQQDSLRIFNQHRSGEEPAAIFAVGCGGAELNVVGTFKLQWLKSVILNPFNARRLTRLPAEVVPLISHGRYDHLRCTLRRHA